MITVAVGNDIKMDNLLLVASDSQFVFNVSSYDKLNDIMIDVVSNACERKRLFYLVCLFRLYLYICIHNRLFHSVILKSSIIKKLIA